MINNKKYKIEQKNNLNISFIAIIIPMIIIVIMYMFLFTIIKIQSIGYSPSNFFNIINKFATMSLFMMQLYLLFNASLLVKDKKQKILNIIYSFLGIISVFSITGLYSSIYFNENVQKILASSNYDKINNFITLTVIVISIFLILNLIGYILFIIANVLNKNKFNIICIISFLILFLTQIVFNCYWIYKIDIFENFGFSINQISSYLIISLPWNFLILSILLISIINKEKILYIGIIIISIIEIITSIFKLITGDFIAILNMLASSIYSVLMAIFLIVIFFGTLSIYILIIISASNSIIRKNKDVHSS